MMSERRVASTKVDCLHGRFSDFDELGKLGGWDFDFRHLDPGAPEILASVVSTGRVAIMKVHTTIGVHQRGLPPPGMVSFGLPIEGLRDWFGCPFSDQGIVPFNYDSGIDGVSRSGFEAFTLSVSEDFLDEISQLLHIGIPDHLVRPESGTQIPISPSVRRLRQTLGTLIESEVGRLDEDVEVMLIADLLTSSAESSPTRNRISSTSRARAVHAAIEYIEEHQHEAPSVSELCRQTGVSWRTLDRAFLERFGIGPKRYLQRLRLAGVRADLARRSGGTLIVDIANQWGFWHMGQFARDYRREFGELPSEAPHPAESGDVTGWEPIRAGSTRALTKQLANF